MKANKAYLNCLSRDSVQKLWLEQLDIAGFFANEAVEELLAAEALGRVTGRSVYAERSAPHYNSSAMDGIAVRAQDTYEAQETAPKRLRLLAPEEPFAPGGCYVVDTGDVLPSGTNAVIMVEEVHFSGQEAEIVAAASPCNM